MCFPYSLYGTLKVLWSSFGAYIECHGAPKHRGSWIHNSPSKKPLLPSVLHAGLPYLISIFTLKNFIYVQSDAISSVHRGNNNITMAKIMSGA